MLAALASSSAIVPPRDWNALQSDEGTNVSGALDLRDGLFKQLMQQAHIAREEAGGRFLQPSSLRCAVVQRPVALIIAADIRMHPLPWERKLQFARLRAFARQSSLFVHTDLAFAEDVQQYFGHAVAVRYTEEEDGGIPPKYEAGPEGSHRAGLMIQWWRLRRAWKLLKDYEGMCGHRHEFVMKMRTDMWLEHESRRPFSNLYKEAIAPKFGRNSSVAFLSSDRFFAGSHTTFASLVEFPQEWGTTYHDHLGLLGVCDRFASVLAQAETSTKAYELALKAPFNWKDRKDCVMLERPQMCREACSPADINENRYKACPVHESDRPLFQGSKKTLASHSFGKHGGVVDFKSDRDALRKKREHAFGQNQPTPAAFACMMRYSARKRGGSEMSFVYHAFFRGHPIRSISQIDPTVWSLKSHSLESWRHQIHMWRDGFTVQDGPLQGFEIAANARLGAEMQLDPKRGVPRLRVAEAAVAAAMEMNAARLQLQEPPSGYAEPLEWLPALSNEDEDDEEDDEEDVVYTVIPHNRSYRHAVLGSGPGLPEFSEFVARQVAAGGVPGPEGSKPSRD